MSILEINSLLDDRCFFFNLHTSSPDFLYPVLIMIMIIGCIAKHVSAVPCEILRVMTLVLHLGTSLFILCVKEGGAAVRLGNSRLYPHPLLC